MGEKGPSSQKVETQMSINWWADEQNVVDK